MNLGSEPSLRTGSLPGNPNGMQAREMGEAYAWAHGQNVEINGRTLQILATATSAQGQPYTTVLGPNGVVGQTSHEVVIAETPTQTVRSRLAAVLANRCPHAEPSACKPLGFVWHRKVRRDCSVPRLIPKATVFSVNG